MRRRDSLHLMALRTWYMSLSRAGNCWRFGLLDVKRPVAVLTLKDECTRLVFETYCGSFVRNVDSDFSMAEIRHLWASPVQPSSPSRSFAVPNLPLAGSFPASTSSSALPTEMAPFGVLGSWSVGSPKPPTQTPATRSGPLPNSNCRSCTALRRFSRSTSPINFAHRSWSAYRFVYSLRTQARKASSATFRSFCASLACNSIKLASRGTPRPSILARVSPKGHQNRR
mmetsp:Transcript_80271/g.239046  ORF Transcript_80271/g.239046 Transcript_80271/m.239046 type:complete len:227 (-) Transcript_80271:1809-2489(-)